MANTFSGDSNKNKFVLTEIILNYLPYVAD